MHAAPLALVVGPSAMYSTMAAAAAAKDGAKGESPATGRREHAHRSRRRKLARQETLSSLPRPAATTHSSLALYRRAEELAAIIARLRRPGGVGVLEHYQPLVPKRLGFSSPGSSLSFDSSSPLVDWNSLPPACQPTHQGAIVPVAASSAKETAEVASLVSLRVQRKRDQV